jgi:hypothetical protein
MFRRSEALMLPVIRLVDVDRSRACLKAPRRLRTHFSAYSLASLALGGVNAVALAEAQSVPAQSEHTEEKLAEVVAMKRSRDDARHNGKLKAAERVSIGVVN